jgi:hypothetical protein
MGEVKQKRQNIISVETTEPRSFSSCLKSRDGRDGRDGTVCVVLARGYFLRSGMFHPPVEAFGLRSLREQEGERESRREGGRERVVSQGIFHGSSPVPAGNASQRLLPEDETSPSAEITESATRRSLFRIGRRVHLLGIVDAAVFSALSTLSPAAVGLPLPKDSQRDTPPPPVPAVLPDR